MKIISNYQLSIINYPLSIGEDVFDQGIKGLPFNPVVVDPLRTTKLSDF